MRKYKLISALAEETAKEVVRNEENWRRYLNTASRLYKYPFKEQLLIYAQRPEATACASIEIWNEKMHCWVNKGAKGIALIDEDSFSGLKYVFDISDVHKARRIGQFPNLWEMREEHMESAGSLEPSHVLLSLGLSHETAQSALRFSLCEYNTMDEVQTIITKVTEAVNRLRR